MNELDRHNMRAAQERQKRNHDKKIKKKYQYKVGEKVLVYLNVVRKGGVRKLERQWRGPFEITKIKLEGRFYEFELQSSENESQQTTRVESTKL